jgi:aspartate carbamoyltransferase catalytic subunit
MKHLFDTHSLSLDELRGLLESARVIESQWPSGSLQNSLRDKFLINMFYEASTRTRVSFEVAAKRLGMQVVNFTAVGSSAEKGETLHDTFETLQAMRPDIIVVRHKEEGTLASLAQQADESLHLINAGEGTRMHPSQALIDAYTIEQNKGSIEGLNIVIAGDVLHSRVAASNIDLLSRLGAAQIRLCGPAMLLPDGFESERVRYFDNLEEAVQGADVVMMLRIQTERMSTSDCLDPQKYREHWCFNSLLAKLAAEDFVILHPGPMNRGVEITDEVADGPRSLIRQQVANSVFVRMAIISALLQ